jgi:hypothetical protein
MGEHRETHGWLRSGEEMATGPFHFAVFRDSAIPGVQFSALLHFNKTASFNHILLVSLFSITTFIL